MRTHTESITLAAGALILATHHAAAEPAYLEPIVAADISSLSRVIDANLTYTDFRGERGLAEMMADTGYNTARLRLWVDPEDGYNNLADTLRIAKLSHDAGLDIWLDFHYSDVWADPGKQFKPSAWEELEPAQLALRVRTYTRDVIDAFEQAGTPARYVQIGNEVQNGMLWDDGRIFPDNFPGFLALIEAAREGIRDANVAEEPVIIMHSGGPNAGPFFFQQLEASNFDYDIAALSYYPYFHDGFDRLSAGIDGLLAGTDKPILIAELGYPWTLGFADNTGNLVGQGAYPDDLIAAYLPSADGQAAYLEAVWDIIHDIPDDRGIGAAYWEPAWLPDAVGGSALENLALFDFHGNALPAFDRLADAASPIDGRRIGRDPVYTRHISAQTRRPAEPSAATALDALFVDQRAGGLRIGIAGAIEANHTALVILLDIDPLSPAGQSTLLVPAGLPAGLPALDGVAFDAGFAPDVALAINIWDGILYADFLTLTDTGTVNTYLGFVAVGSGATELQSGDNPTGIRIAYDGLAPSCADPLTNTRGLEIDLPRAALPTLPGHPLGAGDSIGVAAFVINRDGTFTDQWLPPIPTGAAVPDLEAPQPVDLGDTPGDQHATVPLAQAGAPRGAPRKADTDRSGTIDAADVTAFLAALDRRWRTADLNHDDTLDAFDLSAFLNLAAEHC